MLQKTCLGIIFFLLIPFIFKNTALGQELTTTTTSTTTVTPTSTPTTNAGSRKEALKNRLLEKTGNAAPTLLQETVEEKKGLMAEKQAEIEAMRAEKKAEIEAAKLAFEEQLETITDEQKKIIVERINTRLAETNMNSTDRMFTVLDQLSAILTKIETKITTAKTAGSDTSVQDEELENAQLALDAAIKTVTEQAAMEYIITINDSTTLKNDVGQTVSDQKQDLRTTYESVRSARTAARQAAKSLKTLGVTPSPTTPSGTTSTPSALPANSVTPSVNPI